MRQLIATLGTVLLAASWTLGAEGQEITKSWSMAEFGEPQYKNEDEIEHWPYANPEARKGGKIVLGAFGSFDSLNTIILKGQWPRSIGLVSDGLMTGSADEIGVLYGLIAETVEFPEDKSWIVFNIRQGAKYHDGVAITAGDFVYQFETMMEHGRPFLKSFFEEVQKAEALDDQRLKYTFNTLDSMKPLIKVAGLGPLPRHYWKDRDISKTYLEPPLTSGPYRIDKLEPGRSITYRRVDDYWGKDLPVNIGTENIDVIRYDYYRDMEIMLEAFKAGEIDFREENSAKRWATGYKMAEVDNGQMIVREQADATPRSIQGYFFNMRRPKFQDAKVREAISLLYDFETLKRTVLYGQYQRIKSFFPNSDYGASGPPTEQELAILEPFRDQLPPPVLEQAFEPSATDGSGQIRRQLRQALQLFQQAGWRLGGGKLVKEGEQMKIEFLTAQAESQRTLGPFTKNLKRAGIDASIRLVDTAQYEVRLDDFDFDMVTVFLNFFPPPGPELRSYYGSAAADIRGSANFAAIKNPVVDALIEQIIEAKDLATLKATTRSLDRVFLWNFYAIPQFYNDKFRLAYWNKFAFPETTPKYGTGFPSTWWIDPELSAKLQDR